MAGLVHISDAVVLALHALAYLAKKRAEPVSAREMSEAMRVSLAHLAKVLQRLEKAGLVKSKRGPQGGFRLGRGQSQITLKHIYETIAGKLRFNGCLLGQPFCQGYCPLSQSLQAAEQDIIQKLGETTLADFAGPLRLKSHPSARKD
ncbi:Rrf2 family transcriptional regulator [candidate division FCPU426 bacterium]|nr:Rrf2 family transcriptional regulator [candidate division FCPU426 bacterium]